MNQAIYEGIMELEKILPVNKKIFLVCGKSFFDLSIKENLEKYPKVIFSDFTPNPRYEDVCNGVRLFNMEKCALILAVGGGSAIDVAKCIKLFCRMDTNRNFLEQEKIDSKVPLIAIPTTGGSGSESTKHAVIYYEGKKQSISDDSIIPDAVCLDSSVLANLPSYQRKCTMMDALCQAIESWWSVNSTAESIEYSKKAIAAILKHWKSYIMDNQEISYSHILHAANDAGKAINLTATTAAHAMSYQITSLYHLPHGHAVALCLPEVWTYLAEHIQECIDSRGTEHLCKVLEQLNSMLTLNNYCKMLKEMELLSPFSEKIIFDESILAESVNLVRLKNFPVNLTKDDLKSMYKRVMRLKTKINYNSKKIRGRDN